MKRILSLMRRALDDYQMIEDNDRVAVGLSGGKDSQVLLLGLSRLKKFYPKRFELCAIIIDMGFPGMDFSPMKTFCEQLEVPLVLKKTEISEVIFQIRKEENPCSLCAKMRRGVLNETAREQGMNKVALGHHSDDALETFFLSLFYEGRISCFSPATYLSRTDITQIRPMIYLSEKEIVRSANRQGLQAVKNPCPANGNTKREEMKEFIKGLEKEHDGVKGRIFGAIQRGEISGWNRENVFIPPPEK